MCFTCSIIRNQHEDALESSWSNFDLLGPAAGGQCTLALVTDPAEQEDVQETRSKNYPQLKLPPGVTIVSFPVLDR